MKHDLKSPLTIDQLQSQLAQLFPTQKDLFLVSSIQINAGKETSDQILSTLEKYGLTKPRQTTPKKSSMD